MGALSPHYQAVAAEIPLSGADEALGAYFPSYRAALETLEPSPSGATLLESLGIAQSELAAAGALTGRARLAVHTDGGPSGCRHCGLCLTGCPIGAVYETGVLILALARRGALQYYDRQLVLPVSEKHDKAELEVRDIDTGAVEWHSFDTVILGAGTVGTSQILLRSQAHFDQQLLIKEAPMIQSSQFGASAHIGSAYPMRHTVNEPFSSDVLGRPAGYYRTHIIDGAAFPFIPATTMALTVMANAHRIGTFAPQ